MRNIFFLWWETLAKVCRENHIALQSGPSERVHVSRATPERDPRVTEREEGDRQTTVTFNY